MWAPVRSVGPELEPDLFAGIGWDDSPTRSEGVDQDHASAGHTTHVRCKEAWSLGAVVVHRNPHPFPRTRHVHANTPGAMLKGIRHQFRGEELGDLSDLLGEADASPGHCLPG